MMQFCEVRGCCEVKKAPTETKIKTRGHQVQDQRLDSDFMYKKQSTKHFFNFSLFLNGTKSFLAVYVRIFIYFLLLCQHCP